MIVIALFKKILSLFIIIFLGALLVRLKLVSRDASKSISLVSLYMIVPCMIICSFQVEYSAEIKNGLLLTLFASLAIQAFYILLVHLIRRPLHLDAVEQTSIIYSNALNLIIPLVSAILGDDYMIYTSVYSSTLLVLMWTHCKAVLCGSRGIELKKILTNVNIWSIVVGVVLFTFSIKLVSPLQDAVSSLGSMLTPLSMLVTGMLIGGMDLKKVFTYKRVWLVALMRLVILPIPILLFLKFGPLASMLPDGKNILLIPLMASSTPTASMLSQMAQVYNCDAEYASAINVVSTLVCILTVPVIVALYQL